MLATRSFIAVQKIHLRTASEQPQERSENCYDAGRQCRGTEIEVRVAKNKSADATQRERDAHDNGGSDRSRVSQHCVEIASGRRTRLILSSPTTDNPPAGERQVTR